METLFESAGTRSLLFHDLSVGSMVQANQHLVIRGDEGLLLDPGGHKVHSRLFAEMASALPISRIRHIVFSHQDPDIIAAANAWLMMTDALAYLPSLWLRFIPHFGVDELVVSRIRPVPDEGLSIDFGGAPVKLLPAHFLHSPGNLQVWDPVSRILYSGDLGSSLGQPYTAVPDFDRHVQFMEGFHRRYIASNRALRAWAGMARALGPEIIAPQHGAMFVGRETVARFIAWVEGLQCGVDLLPETFQVPA